MGNDAFKHDFVLTIAIHTTTYSNDQILVFLHDFYGFWCYVENVCGVNLILDPQRVMADQAYWSGISFNLPGTLY